MWGALAGAGAGEVAGVCDGEMAAGTDGVLADILLFLILSISYGFRRCCADSRHPVRASTQRPG